MNLLGSASDDWRRFGDYRLPDHLGGGHGRLRLDQTTDDLERGFNREEHLRPIPPGDPDHDRLYGRRNDTESGNRLLDDSMLRERAHTVGRRQLVNLITWAPGATPIGRAPPRTTAPAPAHRPTSPPDPDPG